MWMFSFLPKATSNLIGDLGGCSFQRLVNIKKAGGFIDWLHNYWWLALIGLGTDIKCSEIDSAESYWKIIISVFVWNLESKNLLFLN